MEDQLKVVTTELPAEIAPLAAGVASEKSEQVMAVLANVFSGVEKMRAALDAVTVQDEHDKASMASAKEVRLQVKRTRLDAEKQFDAKRTEVQALMSSYKTEDTLWLKSKQIMQATCKEIEAMAEWKEATAERIAAERLELRTMERSRKVACFSDLHEIDTNEYAAMSDAAFDAFLGGLKKAHEDKIEEEAKAKAEAEAKAKAEAEERARLQAENERLEKEAAAAAAKAKAEAEKAAKERAEAEAKIRAEAAAEKAKAEAAAAKAKAEAEKLKADAAAKAKAEAEKAKAEADRLEALKQAGDGEKLRNFAANLAAFMQLPENALTLESDAAKTRHEMAVKHLREAYKILSA